MQHITKSGHREKLPRKTKTRKGFFPPCPALSRALQKQKQKQKQTYLCEVLVNHFVIFQKKI